MQHVLTFEIVVLPTVVRVGLPKAGTSEHKARMIGPVAVQVPAPMRIIQLGSVAPVGGCAVIATADQRVGKRTAEHQGGCLMCWP